MVIDSRMSLSELQRALEREEAANPARRALRGRSFAWLGDVTLLAQRLTGMPIAFISVLDSSTAHFVAQRGAQLVPEPRAAMLGHLVAESHRPVVIRDAAADSRLAGYAAVHHGLRTYVGVPFGHQPDSPVAFALCVADEEPREEAAEAVEALEALARLTERALERLPATAAQ